MMKLSPTLTGSRISLTPVTGEDLSYLYKWAIDVESMMLWTNRRNIPPLQHYIEESEVRIKSNIITQLMIHQNDINTTIGTVYAYDAHLTDGFLFMTLFLINSHISQGYGAEASLLFIDYLFSYFPLRKIYTEVYDYNERSLHFHRRAGLQEEGCFLQHRFFNGVYADLYRFALYRSAWPEIRNRYIETSQSLMNKKGLDGG